MAQGHSRVKANPGEEGKWAMVGQKQVGGREQREYSSRGKRLPSLGYPTSGGASIHSIHPPPPFFNQFVNPISQNNLINLSRGRFASSHPLPSPIPEWSLSQEGW